MPVAALLAPSVHHMCHVANPPAGNLANTLCIVLLLVMQGATDEVTPQQARSDLHEIAARYLPPLAALSPSYAPGQLPRGWRSGQRARGHAVATACRHRPQVTLRALLMSSLVLLARERPPAGQYHVAGAVCGGHRHLPGRGGLPLDAAAGD